MGHEVSSSTDYQPPGHYRKTISLKHKFALLFALVVIGLLVAVFTNKLPIKLPTHVADESFKALQIADQDPTASSLLSSGASVQTSKLPQQTINSMKSAGFVPSNSQNLYRVDYVGSPGTSLVVDVDSGKIVRKFVSIQVGSR